MMTTVAADFDHMELQQQYSSSNDTVNNRWDDEWDNENSSARLFERSRIKALAGTSQDESIDVFRTVKSNCEYRRVIAVVSHVMSARTTLLIAGLMRFVNIAKVVKCSAAVPEAQGNNYC